MQETKAAFLPIRWAKYAIAARCSVFVCALLACVLLAMPSAMAQTASASLSGIIADPDGARIPGAAVVIVNTASKDKRTTKANSDGVFDFSALSPGTYTLTSTFQGFETTVVKGIQLHPGDTDSLPPVTMKIGKGTETVEVNAQELTSSNGEVSSLITAEDIKHLATEGRDVTELVKILPGFALQPGAASGGGLSNTAPDTEVVGPGGSLGNYSANGTPSNGIGLISDGANVQDPGAGGATTQSINMDMVEEVKVSTSNFGADTAKGPVVINAVGKAGGQDYHGSIYIIARTYQLNSQDWLLKNQQQPKPNDRYLYPGFSIGGPIKIPGTNFNQQKKLLFLVGGEDYIQRNAFLGGSGASALRLSTVPTDAMRGGDFSATSLANLFNVTTSDLNTNCNLANPLGTLYTFINYCQPLAGVGPASNANGTNGLYTPNGDTVTNGKFSPADIDPGAQVYLNSLFPHQNRIAQPVLGTLQESDGFDRADLVLTNYDLYQVRGRIDYNASQNNKFYTVYNVERGYSYNPYSLYYVPTGPNGALRDPSLIKSGVNSQTASANFVHIFGPTLTSESFAAASYYYNNFNATNQSAQTIATLNYPYEGLLKNGSQQLPQIGYGPTGGSGLPLYQSPDFSFGESFSRKIALDFGENVTKVWREHTIKVGFYFEHDANNQLTATGGTQGAISEYGTYVTYNAPVGVGGALKSQNPDNTLADFFFGAVANYSQLSNSPIVDMNYLAIDGFATDSWKATKRLTVDFGVRFDHLGPWTDPHNIGPAFWYPSVYAATAPTSATVGLPVSQFPGITWHGKDSTQLDSVQPGRWAFVSPRVGFALDAYGTGRTIFNGGFGFYRSHDSWNDYVGPLSTPLGSISNYVSNVTLASIDARTRTLSDTSCKANPTLGGCTFNAENSPSISALDPNDDQQPLTMTYSFGVNQALRHAGNLVINYVGNQSSHLLLTNGLTDNVNYIKQGGLFAPDPNPYSPNYGQIATAPDSIQYVDDYRPYSFYNSINIERHVLHSSYNSLQTTWSKWSGPFHYNLNYTWSKALGDRGADGNGNAADATNARNNYGIAAFDRTHAFNASYTYIEGKAFHVARIASAFINNWEISGITNIQSGPNIQASYGNNFQLTAVSVANLNSASSPTNVSYTDNKTYLGTPDILLQPIMTCNPTVGLKQGQYINGACLTIGPQGMNGPFRYPYIRGPYFFNSDLSAQKSFHFEGKKEIQFRYAAFNFLNHPLTSLVAATASPLRLVIAGAGVPATSTFGISDYKQGRRVSEISLRFNF